jgi:hypothetical protein
VAMSAGGGMGGALGMSSGGASHGGGSHGGHAADADVEELRYALAEQRTMYRELQRSLADKEDSLAGASRRRMESDDQRRRAEQQAIRRLQEEARTKDALLERKSRELAQLQDETRRWFEQYKASQPADQAPVNYAAIRKMSEAVTKAESAEERYRSASWELIARDLKQRTALEGLRADCQEAEAARDVHELRLCQRAYDTIAHHTRQKCQRLRQMRGRLREEANRHWDVVLYYARSVHHAEEPLPPPPRYYAVDASGNGNVGPSTLPPSPVKQLPDASSVIRERNVAGSTLHRRVGSLGLGRAPLGDAPAPKPSPRRPDTAPSFRPTATTSYNDLNISVAGGGPASGDSPFVTRVRGEMQSQRVDSVRLPSKPGGEASIEGPARAGGRPQSAMPSRPMFSPAALRGQSMADKRAALVQLMRYDQDLLSVCKTRHIDGLYKVRATRGTSNNDGSAPGLSHHRLIGRNEGAHSPSQRTNGTK